MSAMKIKKGDTVRVIAGKDKFKEGKVSSVDKKNNNTPASKIKTTIVTTKATRVTAACPLLFSGNCSFELSFIINFFLFLKYFIISLKLFVCVCVCVQPQGFHVSSFLCFLLFFSLLYISFQVPTSNI